MPGPDSAADADEIVHAIAVTPGPAVFASEIAAVFDMSNQWARDKLSELETAGLVKRKGTKSNRNMWWLSDEGQQLARKYAQSSSTQ